MGLGKRGLGGDMVLESRHVVGIFLLLVVISGVVFTLGYVLGRSQYYTQVRVAASGTKPSARPEPEPAPPKPGETTAASQPAPVGLPAPSDLDFYRAAAEPKKLDELRKPEKPAAAANKPTAATSASSRPPATNKKGLVSSSLIPRGAILLQVAALTREDDALALAEALQHKKFPAFVLTPGADHYYRVQVGPYADTQSATIARKALDHEGFKAITRR